MKILFVRPRQSPETIGLQHVMLVEPLELEVMASLVDDDDKSCIIDMILEKRSIKYFIEREKPDLFCVTGYITNVPEMKEYCRTAKKWNPKIIAIVGGVHCEVCPEDLNDEFIDFRVIRNATTVFPLLLKHIKYKEKFPAGVLRFKEKPDLEKLPAFDFSFPFPDRNLTEKYRKRYFYIFHNKVALLKTAFGCPYNCNFCFCRTITRDHYFERPLQDVIQELSQIKEKDIYIVDDDFLSGRNRVQKFIEAVQLADLKKNYLLYGRADFIADNPDIIASFNEIGLKTVIVGFESFSDKELIKYNKEINSEMNKKAMDVLNKYNIDCYATIIIPPEWGREEFEECKTTLLKLGIHYVNLQPLTPLPGTEFIVNNENLVFPYSDHHKWDLAHISINPEKLDIADFYEAILKLYRAILYQPRYLLSYLKNYSIPMIYKMIRGVYLVQKQYLRKIKQVKENA